MLLDTVYKSIKEVGGNALPEPIEFFPFPPGYPGWVATSWCLRMAKHSDRSPQQLAQAIIQGLPSEFREEVKEEKGYLNVRFRLGEEGHSSLLPVELQCPDSSTVVILPPRTGAHASFGYLRLVCAALFQVFLLQKLQRRVTLCCGDFEQQWESNSGEVRATQVLHALLQEPSRSTQEALTSLSKQLYSSADRKVLWVSTTTFPRKEFQQIIKGAQNVSLLCLPQEWFYEPLISYKTEEILFDEEKLRRFLLLLSSSRGGKELDLSTPLFNEAENLPWLFSWLQEKPISLLPEQQWRNLTSLSLAVRWAAARGEVLTYVDELRSALFSLMKILGRSSIETAPKGEIKPNFYKFFSELTPFVPGQP